MIKLYRDLFPLFLLFGLAFFVSAIASAETYNYDASGRLASVIYDDDTTIDYSYDPNGNVLSMIASTIAQGGGNVDNNPDPATEPAVDPAPKKKSGGGGRVGLLFFVGLFCLLMISFKRRDRATFLTFINDARQTIHQLSGFALLTLVLFFSPEKVQAHQLFETLNTANGSETVQANPNPTRTAYHYKKPDLDGVYYTFSFNSVDPDCTATLSLTQTGGPSGIFSAPPTPPAGPVKNWAFDFKLIKIPDTKTTVNYRLTWVGSGGPEFFCGTNTETNNITLVVENPLKGNGDLLFAGIMPEDPVNSFNGELFNSYAPDLNLGGPMPLLFNRYYGAFLSKGSLLTSKLGTNWLHNFDMNLTKTNANIVVFIEQGRTVQFFEGSNNSIVLDTSGEIQYELVKSGANYLFYNPVNGLQYTFNSSGKLTKIADGQGNIHTLTYSGSKLSKVSDGLGRTITFVYSGGKLSKIKDNGTPIRTITFAHTGGNLTGVTDALGNTTTYSYDTSHTLPGLMTQTLRPEGNSPYRQSFDAEGRVSSQTDALNNINSVSYGVTTTTVTDPLSNGKTHTHSESGELTTHQGEDGQDIGLSYDNSGRKNAITDRLNAKTNYSYDPASGNVASISHADGSIVHYSYTARSSNGLTIYDLTTITYPDGTNENFTYDVNGHLTRYTDRAGKFWDATNNANGQILTSTNPAGGITTFTYDTKKNINSITDPAGNATTYTYDSYNRVVTVTHADTSTWTFTYDANDNRVTETDEDNNTTTYTYDNNNRLTSIENALGQTKTLAYDLMDRLISVTDAKANVTSRSYDQLGRLKSTTDRAGNTTQYGYDARGRLTSITDPASKLWQHSYDAEDILASQTDPLGNVTRYTSDAMGRTIDVTTPLSNKFTLGYDSMGHRNSVTNSQGIGPTQIFDERGQVIKNTLPGNISASFSRNSLGQTTQITDPNSNIWKKGYDNQGRLISSTDPLNRQNVYTYDNRNQLTLVTFAEENTSLNQSFDVSGNLTRRHFKIGTATDTDLNYGYDQLGRLTSASQGSITNITLSYDANNELTESNGIAITRDSGTRMATLTYAPGKTVTYTYDTRNQLTRIRDWNNDNTDFTYDASGRLSSITRPNGIITTYNYDADNNLTSINESTIGNIALTRNALGQITSITRDLPQSNSAVNLNDTLFSFDAANQITSQSYDTQGRLISDGTKNYTWDLASRLISLSEGGATITYGYDALNNRNNKTQNGITTKYIWNYATGLPSIAIERDTNDNDLHYNITTPDGILVYRINASNNARHDYHFDERGNTSFLSDSAGAVSDSYAYTPFGKLIGKSGTTANPFTWQGRYQIIDEGNALFYVRARYYDSQSQRFISKDSLRSSDPRHINPYQFAFNDPMTLNDMTGLAPNESSINFTSTSITSRLKIEIDGGFDLTTDAGIKFKNSDRLNLASGRFLGDIELALPFTESKRKAIKAKPFYKGETFGDFGQKLHYDFDNRKFDNSDDALDLSIGITNSLLFPDRWRKTVSEVKEVENISPMKWNPVKIQLNFGGGMTKVDPPTLDLNEACGTVIESVVPDLTPIVVLC